MAIKRIVFDLDGTLLNCDYEDEKLLFQTVFGEDDETLLPHISKYLDYYEKHNERYDEDLLASYLSLMSGKKVTPQFIRDWIDVMGQTEDTMEEGVIETLEHFKKKDKSLVVLTNWFRGTQVTRLKRAGIYDYFDEVYTGESALKPHKEAYEQTLGFYHPKEVLFFGDNVDMDYIGPRASGMPHSVLYDKEEKHHNTIVKVKSLEEFRKRY